MKRRFFVKALAAAPVAPALLAQQPLTAPDPDALAPIAFSRAEDVAQTVLSFFDDRQYATLVRLCDLLMPQVNGNPGAGACQVPEFLEFLLRESPQQRQQMYRRGLDELGDQAKDKFRKVFALTSDDEAHQILASLRQPWTYDAPNALVEFLRAARVDVRNATLNSPQYARGNPSRAPSGQYWKAME